MQVEGLDAAVIDYINELKTFYEQQIKELKNIYEEQINKLKDEVKKYHNQYVEMHDKYSVLACRHFGRSSEKINYDDNQPFLFAGEVEPEEMPTEEEEKTAVKPYTRSKRGRKPIDQRIERKPREIDIPESEKKCACGAELTRIGEEITEKLVYKPAEIYVDQIIRPKYACRCCEGTEDEDNPTVRIAPSEPSMIPGSISTPSLLTAIFTGKFEDHMPYNRQEKQFERIGAGISKQDMSNWQQRVYEKLFMLFELMLKNLKSGSVMQMDETSMYVMSGEKTKKEEKAMRKPEERKPDIHHGWMWLARGGPPGKKITWYEYHESRAGKYAEEFLKGYSGYLQTDGYEGYDYAVKNNPNIIHAGCFAHARRYFFEASKSSKKSLSAEEGMKYIRKLYEIEDKLRDEKKEKENTDKKISEEEFVEKRKSEAEPILKQFKSWLLKRTVELPPTGLMGKAVNYTLKEWDKLTAYLGSYHLTPDNNACENAIRPFVVGRKNWMIAGSPQGAKSSCAIYSLIETAKQNGKEPYKYLEALFEKAPLASTVEDWEKLLPWNISLK